jgi:hypothetical protein
MPSDGDSKIRDSAGVIKQMVGNFRPDEDDVIVIAGADTGRLAEDAARTAAWTLLKELAWAHSGPIMHEAE